MTNMDFLQKEWKNKLKRDDTYYLEDPAQWALSNYGRSIVRHHDKNPLPYIFNHFDKMKPHGGHVSHFVKQMRPLPPPDSSFMPAEDPYEHIYPWTYGV